ncbi:MAG: 3-deoxy-D-manno-octulosonate 8-phosphate phosphatase [Bacteroidetes bacterium GWF2_42_66]|nr:MAG: 3-deoxy-D-manno-octulosonate 8-phosphate phosphatase [Bacteroidetes bacterium GWA2_42_15]OFX96349.1 MAG: 3-deoxy-D-manno-octulosonate 8-phosphate phosphatase [Bacteroidetes bacterium GWE2_42_39]OFY46388.1 MAG: 3-deoxy-D-manno-octulosonate 8-phosphate phosphatase [Bacteroidetes bacterium GWF2_42_66]HBL78226.1 3-deoxy-D-manno-octulosonate 8-phosphate phosphatase [Prolixibacteraceae bacterium]HCR89936.1 3-deoxy-D-manno-octulosonate 8-phosphate phosphatase [Prolixibacteraceae bacterium]
MAFLKEEFKQIKAFIFDVDGVLSADISHLNEDGDPIRTTNMKDGYAIRNAMNNGYEVAIITGGTIERVKLRYEKLGVKHIYMGSFNKLESLVDFLAKTGVSKSEIVYMGDDIIDYLIMKEVGMPTCPKDAVHEIREISKYISDKKGGEGCVRDIVEQVMRAQGNWINENAFYWKTS